MVERPMLFSGHLVRAILDGTKTQTRRPVKPQPEPCDHSLVKGNPSTKWFDLGDGTWACSTCGNGVHYAGPSKAAGIRCPFGVLGDRLWVRETWASPETDKSKPGRVAYDADGACGCWIGGGEDRHFIYHGRILESSGYRKCFPPDGSSTLGLGKYSDIRSGEFPSYRYGWRPSIHMPRWASRLTLEITDVRVERVQEISEEDAKAEGIERVKWDGDPTDGYDALETYRASFRRSWDAIYANQGYGWDANPWVWVIGFRGLQ